LKGIPAEECKVSIRYDNKCWTNKIATVATAEDIIGIARRYWRIPAERQLTVRETHGRMEPHLLAEYLVETERQTPPEGYREIDVSWNGNPRKVRVIRGADQREFERQLEHTLGIEKGKYTIRYDGAEDFDLEGPVEVRTGVYAIHVTDAENRGGHPGDDS
jgi:hypothetical protein